MLENEAKQNENNDLKNKKPKTRKWVNLIPQ